MNMEHRVTEKPEILDPTQVAEWLGVSRAWVIAHSSGNRRPRIPNVKLGKNVRFNRDEVLDFIRRHTRREE